MFGTVQKRLVDVLQRHKIDFYECNKATT